MLWTIRRLQNVPDGGSKRLVFDRTAPSARNGGDIRTVPPLLLRGIVSPTSLPSYDEVWLGRQTIVRFAMHADPPSNPCNTSLPMSRQHVSSWKNWAINICFLLAGLMIGWKSASSRNHDSLQPSMPADPAHKSEFALDDPGTAIDRQVNAESRSAPGSVWTTSQRSQAPSTLANGSQEDVGYSVMHQPAPPTRQRRSHGASEDSGPAPNGHRLTNDSRGSGRDVPSRLPQDLVYESIVPPRPASPSADARAGAVRQANALEPLAYEPLSPEPLESEERSMRPNDLWGEDSLETQRPKTIRSHQHSVSDGARRSGGSTDAADSAGSDSYPSSRSGVRAPRAGGVSPSARADVAMPDATPHAEPARGTPRHDVGSRFSGVESVPLGPAEVTQVKQRRRTETGSSPRPRPSRQAPNTPEAEDSGLETESDAAVKSLESELDRLRRALEQIRQQGR